MMYLNELNTDNGRIFQCYIELFCCVSLHDQQAISLLQNMRPDAIKRRNEKKRGIEMGNKDVLTLIGGNKSENWLHPVTWKLEQLLLPVGCEAHPNMLYVP